TVTILDDDPLPTILVRDAIIDPEGSSGCCPSASAVIYLSAPSQRPVTVQYAITDGTAVAGVDYGAPFPSGVLNINPGNTGGIPAEHFFALRQSRFSSWALEVDGVSGDVLPLSVDRLGADGAPLQSASASGSGTSLGLRWENLRPGAIANEHIRVRSGGCG